MSVYKYAQQLGYNISVMYDNITDEVIISKKNFGEHFQSVEIRLPKSVREDYKHWLEYVSRCEQQVI